MFKPLAHIDLATTQVVRKTKSSADLVVRVRTYDDTFRVTFRANAVPDTCTNLMTDDRTEVHLREFDIAMRIARAEFERHLTS